MNNDILGSQTSNAIEKQPKIEKKIYLFPTVYKKNQKPYVLYRFFYLVYIYIKVCIQLPINRIAAGMLSRRSILVQREIQEARFWSQNSNLHIFSNVPCGSCIEIFHLFECTLYELDTI